MRTRAKAPGKRVNLLMKPSFALDLRDEAIRLLHRTSQGWMEIGATRFGAPDMDTALDYMRTTALRLTPRGLATKLILPNDQILYTSVTAPGPDAARRKRQIKAGLDGRTPYGLDELVYDTFGSGPEVQVAVIARETLDQAEAFASEHRFNPVSFVAVPDNGLFLAEPFFGAASMAPSLLAKGEKVERDSDPVMVVLRDPAPAADGPATEAATQAAAAEPTPEPDPAPEVAADAASGPINGPVEEPAPAVEPVADPAPAAAADETALPAAAPDHPTEAQPEELPTSATPAPPETPAPAETLASAEDQAPSPAKSDVTFEEIPDAPIALDVEPLDLPAAPPEPQALKRSLSAVNDPDLDDDVPPPPSEAVRAALAARREERDTGSAPNLGGASRPAMARPVGAIDPAALTGSGKGSAKTPARGSAPGRALKGMGSMVTAPGIAGIGRRKSTTAPQAATSAPGQTSAPAKATGERALSGIGGRVAPAKGKPRFLGLILTGVLLVFLALIAAWSSFFLASLSEDQAAPAPTAISQAETPSPATAPIAAPAADATSEQAAATMTAADGAPPIQLTEGGSTPPPDATSPPQDATAANTQTNTQAAAQAASAETTAAPGPAVSAEAALPQSVGAGPADAIRLAAQEQAPRLAAPGALPDAGAAGDTMPSEAPAPPPFGTVYTFDPQGRIRPTAEGVVTPDGILLVAGKPAKQPPLRPEAIAALAPTPAPATPPDPASANAGAIAPDALAPGTSMPTAEVASDAPFPSDPALAGARPKTRPAGLAPADSGAAEPVLSDPRLASYRPRTRSAQIAPPSATPTEASAVAPTAALGTTLGSTAGLDGASPSPADETASDLAVDVSRLPAARPAGLSQAVDAAVTAALAVPDNAASASAAPEAQAEPDVETKMPDIPTKASVAKTATEKDALTLSKIALIGVFGSEGARYAYVRLGNGALKKVHVGDTLDGGKVVAISASELRYQKGAKVIVLAMPRNG